MQRIILDTDLAMGAVGSDIDDGFALALSIAEPGIALDAVTTVNGNTDIASATWLSIDLLQRLGHANVPVYKGASTPLTRPDRTRPPRPDVQEHYSHHQPADGYAAVEIARRTIAEPGEITLVAIGPLTNLAAAISLDRRVVAAAKEIVIMGGIFEGQTGIAKMPGEFNFWIDPEAADAVMHSGAAIRLVGLDVTRKVRLTRAQAQQLRESPDGSFSRFAAEAAEVWIDHMHAEIPGDPLLEDSCALHDALAVAVVAHPELVTWRPASITVVTGEHAARGVVVTDLLETNDAPAPNCQIAVDVDADAFMAYFLESLSRI